jgi:hypothetical protein
MTTVWKSPFDDGEQSDVYLHPGDLFVITGEESEDGGLQMMRVVSPALGTGWILKSSVKDKYMEFIA